MGLDTKSSSRLIKSRGNPCDCPNIERTQGSPLHQICPILFIRQNLHLLESFDDRRRVL